MAGLRDFIYLDFERVRSYAAQLLEGVPDKQEVGSSHEAGGEASAEAGLFNLMKAQGGADYRYQRSSTETRSLHHQVYVLFEDALEERGYLRTVDATYNYEDWDPDNFVDGEFVKVYGEVRLVNYTKTFVQMQALPKLAGDVAAVLKSGNPKSGVNEDAREMTKVTSELKQLPIKQMAAVAQQLYGDNEFRVKVRPTGAPNEYVLAGTGRTDGLIEAGAAVGPMVRSPIGVEWVVVGQLTLPDQEGSTTDVMATGNEMEDALEGMATTLDGIGKLGSSVAFPALSITPIAVYREAHQTQD